MADDDRTRRRLGDATKNRIDSLASGWTVNAEELGETPTPPEHTPEPAPDPAARKKPRTVPPPPPGSDARKALEQAIVETVASAKPKVDRAQTASKPPPIPQRAKTGSDDLSAPTVPVGEFDHGGLDKEKLRAAFAQQTMKRDSAEALLQIAGAPPTVVHETPVELLLGETAEKLRGNAATVDPSTSPFERGDPTSQGRDDNTELPSGKRARGSTLRPIAALRRKRGIAGDVRYVFTALLGVRQARRELAELEARQQLRQTSRRRHLVTLGRSAVTADGFDHPALGKSREALQVVEEERSKHAGAVAASDAELERVRRDRDTKSKLAASVLTAADVELAALAKRLEPLAKQAASVRKRAAELRESLRQIHKKIDATEAQLVSVKGEKMERAAIQAELATLKADRKAIQRDESPIAAELDALSPRIAEIEASRNATETTKTETQRAEAEDQRRTTELFEAIGAKRKVVERAAADAEAARDRVLFELGDRLYVDRPAILAAQMSPIDQIDLELGESDRRTMELREILASIDRPKLIRGALVFGLAAAVVATIVGWLVYMLV